MNRIKCLRLYHSLSQAEFANLFNVDQTAVSNWEKGKNNIDIKIAEKIAERFSVPMDFVYGRPFSLQRTQNEWYKDEIEDYNSCIPATRDYLLYKWGNGIFHPVPEEEKLTDENELDEDVVIYHRDGKTVRRRFTKEQLDTITRMLDAIPDKPKDI